MEINQEAFGSQQFTAPSVSLPKGGGAVRGIGEKFTNNAVNGTGSLSVPIYASTGRSGFGPRLALSYDSGAGNGSFGFGWSLGLPSVTRKTDKGLPRYRDEEESDVFVLSGAEDLVPSLQQSGGSWQRFTTTREEQGEVYRIHRYRPRIEGLFARIERWTRESDGDVHWRSISKDNLTTFYGKTTASRIADPDDTRKIFQWLICETFDDRGNALIYEYVAENSDGIDLTQPQERNRTPSSRSANRYIKRIKYGNRFSRLVDPLAKDLDWMFEVVFDYEEGQVAQISTGVGHLDMVRAHIAPINPWAVRLDPFSTYRPGFEVRTYRLCRRVLMFHHFPDGPHGEHGYDGLVRATEFKYSENPIASFIASITESGTRLVIDDPTVAANAYIKKSLPQVEFTYSKAEIHEEMLEVDPVSIANLPYGIGGKYQWVDLDGEGLAGVLAEQGGGWYYKRNLSPIVSETVAGEEQARPGFAAVESVTPLPFTVSAGGTRQFLDLGGDGQLDLVDLNRPVAGFFERFALEDWANFRPFLSLPNVRWNDPNLRFVDLTGDGRADVLLTEDDVITWFPSLGEDGFGTAQRVYNAPDEERGPRLMFADGTQSIYLADFSGDGLSDLVRIRNGEVCYWPNLGYGRFGAKVTMASAPWFDTPEQFDQRRIRLADIDGSGLTDIIYVGRDGVSLYFNRSGNSWSEPRQLDGLPSLAEGSSLDVVDLLGIGTACIVWSSSRPVDARAPMRYVKLMGDQKPHLLTGITNNLGAETRIHYAPSTKFYLQDMLAGTPWVTRLPFPVQVVDRIETYDRISHTRFMSRFAYHHGYFDGPEREFRGFGMFEKWDTYEISTVENGFAEPADNFDPPSFVPPIYTRTWFHTGAYIKGEAISQHFAHEYYGAPAPNTPNFETVFEQFADTLLPDTILPDAPLSVAEQQEACRALKGMTLRQEVYAHDGSSKQPDPYTVSELNYTLKLVQPRGPNEHAVFFAHPRESINYHYERNAADPRVQHDLVLQVDAFGNAERMVSIAYPRGNVPGRLPEQEQTHVTLTLAWFINRDDEDDWYRAGLPAETRAYELVKPPRPAGRFTFDDISTLVTAMVPLNAREPLASKTIPNEDWDWRRSWNETMEPGGVMISRLRPMDHVRTLYRKDDPQNSSDLLPLGEIESRALTGEAYKLAFTTSLLSKVFRRGTEDLLPSPASVLTTDGGYLEGDRYRSMSSGLFPLTDAPGQWWIRSGRVFLTEPSGGSPGSEIAFARANFFLPRRFVDPFGNATIVRYDTNNLLLVESEDARGTKSTAGERDAGGTITWIENDYRVLAPRLMTDANRNRTAVAVDALGLVVGTAVMGKNTEQLGDSLTGFREDLELGDIQSFIKDPLAQAAAMVGDASARIVYDLDRFRRCSEPPFAATIAREMHVRDTYYTSVPTALSKRFQISLLYSDGFGRELQTKVRAENGDALKRGPDQAVLAGDPPTATGDVRPGDLVRNPNGDVVRGPAAPRWVGTGRTVYNNKGKPVKRYEPFFSSTHLYEDEPDMTDTGVSSVIFYDPVERLLAVLHPNQSWQKVVFDPWRRETWDVNDTALIQDPKSDPDVGDYFNRLFGGTTFTSWYEARATGQRGQDEKHAASKTTVHANTPAVAHQDSLGRTFLTLAHNRFESNGAIVDESYPSHVTFDREGRQREVRDANPGAGGSPERLVMQYDYDIAGRRWHQASMEAGERWLLTDIAGKPVRTWDSRSHEFTTEYDALRRPVASFVTGVDPQNPTNRLQFGRIVYGDAPNTGLTATQIAADNLRGKIYQLFDTAGVLTTRPYDFKGNLLRSERMVIRDVKSTPDWSASPPPVLEADVFTSGTIYDAMNRPVQVIPTHLGGENSRCTVIQPKYNEAGLPERELVWLNEAAEPQGLLASPPTVEPVTNVDYNAKGQRERIEYGNQAATTYEYEEETFRLVRLRTDRPSSGNGIASQLFADSAIVQDLRYIYDAVGNIIRIADEALQSIVYNNAQVAPASDYTYDAVYRLIAATGREHIGQSAFDFSPSGGNLRDFPFAGLGAPSTDLRALRNYTERYVYDPAGNITNLSHVATNGGWTRTYEYTAFSFLESAVHNNRLTRTMVGTTPETYSYADGLGNDVHGCMTAINSMSLVWNFKDQLQSVGLGGGGTAYYVYDSSGQRVRKVIERQNGTRQKERIYVGGFEVYREYTAAVSGPALERESLHVTDDKLRIVVVDTKTIENGALLATLSPVQRYQLANHLGSATLELDDQADLISYEEYYPYGASSFQVARSGTEVPAKRYRYTAKERDEESGLYYHGARYYAPWLARWVSCDRAAMIDGTNLYAYARDNPLLYFDPKGTQVQGATNDLIDQSTAAEEEFAATAEAESFAGTLSSTAPPGTGASSLSRTFVPGQTSSSASGVSAQSPTNRTLDSTRLIPSWALVAADPKVTDLERWNAPTWQARHPSDMGDALGEFGDRMIWHLPRPIKGLVIDVLTALPDVAPNKQLPGRDDAIDKYFPSTLESPKEISLPPPQIGGYTIEAPSPMSRQPQYAPGNDSGISSVEFAKKSPEEEFMPPANRIQMPLAQEGQARTKPGNWLRDSRWFWAQLLAKRPSLFSNENQKYIDKGLSPKVDPIWLKHHPEQETFIGDFLVHHHIDRGSEAAGVPRRFHQIFHGALHL